MKKFLTLFLGLCIIASFAFSCCFAYTQEQQEAYQRAYRYSITTQPTIEAADLNGNLSRQAFSKMIVNYLEKAVGIKQSNLNSCTFPDENKFNNELKPYAKKTCSYSIMGENGVNFNPSQFVNRAQLGTVFSRILRGNEHNVSGKDYYIYHLNALKSNGIMNKIDNPQAYAKRGDVLIMLKRIYEKYGSNIYMNNGNKSSVYEPIQSSDYTDNYISHDNYENDYINTVYSNSNVIYTGTDGKKYYYDSEFLNMLKNSATKKGESDLARYLEIEADYFKDGFNQLESLDFDNLPEMLGIDEDINPETMTQKEKEALLKTIKEGVNKIIKENTDRNSKYLKDLEKTIKNISNDKFGLKEKYKKTEGFIDASNSFLKGYSEIIFNLMESVLKSENGEISDEEGMTAVFTIMGTALVYQGEAEEYQKYVEEWAINTISLLNLDSGNSGKEYEYTKLDITAGILVDGTVNVKEDFTANFFVPKHGIIRDIPLNYSVGGKDYHIEISNINVQGKTYSTKNDNGSIEIKIGDADRTVSGKQNYPISYTTYGLIKNFSGKGYAELYWNLVGYDFDTNFNKIKAELNLPKVYTGFTADDFLITTDGKLKTIDGFEGTIDRNRGDKIIITYDKGLSTNQGITLSIKFPNDYFQFDSKKQSSLIGSLK